MTPQYILVVETPIGSKFTFLHGPECTGINYRAGSNSRISRVVTLRSMILLCFGTVPIVNGHENRQNQSCFIVRRIREKEEEEKQQEAEEEADAEVCYRDPFLGHLLWDPVAKSILWGGGYYCELHVIGKPPQTPLA